MTNLRDNDRMVRQSQLIAPELKHAVCLVVGLGMLGSWITTTLARIVEEVHGYDFDTVGPENIGTQNYSVEDIGVPKALALQDALLGLPFYAHIGRFDGSSSPAQEAIVVPAGQELVVVSAVDSFDGRRLVAEWAKAYGSLFIDVRAASNLGVVAFATPETIDDYLSNLPSDEDAPEPACGMEGTSYVGMWVAQAVVSTINRYYRGLPVSDLVVYDVGMADVVTFGSVIQRELSAVLAAAIAESEGDAAQ